jgi:PRTRC genetic system protein A
LIHGKIPVNLFDLALNAFLADTEIERYLAITWQGDGYHIWQPEQSVSATSIKYQTMDDVVMELHSHGRIPACFSGQDDRDEQGFKIYGVIGSLPSPKLKLRLGVYGYFQELSFEEVFAGPCPIEFCGDDDD